MSSEPPNTPVPRRVRLNGLGWGAALAALAMANLALMQAPAPWPGLMTGASVLAVLIMALVGFRRMALRLDHERGIARAAQQDLARLANEDPLTRLANRAWFNTELDRAVATARTDGAGFALVMFDLNRFKTINDSFGHAAGDAVLVAAARRIREVAGKNAFAARLGGDEFALIVRQAGGSQDLAAMLTNLSASLSGPVRHEDMEIATGASIGAALCPEHSDESARLRALADRALYRAKSLGGGVCLIDSAMLAASRGEDELVSDIPGGFRRGEFRFFYQTKVRLSDGAHVGFEALARWQHPRLGIVYPSTFIPLLERMGLMVELTRHLLDSVAADIVAWRAAGYSPGPVAVNLPEAILGTNLALRQVEEVLARHDLPWSAIMVELTEDVFIDRALTQIEANVRELSRRGMRIALDDFGTGYASLSHLRNFSFDEIKIDRSFVGDIGRDANCERIVAAMIALGRDLGKVVVAEGIETPEQRGWLREHGCNIGQGFLFGKPEPAELARERMVPVSGLIDAARRMKQALDPKDGVEKRRIG